MSHEKPQYVSAPGPDLAKPFWLNHGLRNTFLFKDALSRREKRDLLAESVEKLSLLFSENGVPFPKNPYARIRFLKLLPFSLAAKHFGYEIYESGFALAETGFGFVDIWSAEYNEKKSNIPKENSLKRIGIHELLHCLEITKWWKEKDKKTTEYSHLNRMGFATRKPQKESFGPNASRSIGGRELNEGLAQYLSSWAIGDEIKNKTAEVRVIEYLVDKIGIGPLVKGAYLENGLRALNEKMAEVFGKGSLGEMLCWMGLEYVNSERKMAKSKEKKPLEKYTKTLEYLDLMRSLTQQRAIIHAFKTSYRDKIETVIFN